MYLFQVVQTFETSFQEGKNLNYYKLQKDFCAFVIEMSM